MWVKQWRGPDEPWPGHDDDEVDAQIDRAKAKGWWFRKTSDHSFGQLSCAPPGVPKRCKAKSIYSTSENTANVVKGWLRRCPHERRTLDEIEALLGSHEVSVDDSQDAVSERLREAHLGDLRRAVTSAERLGQGLQHMARIEAIGESISPDELRELEEAEPHIRESLADLGIDHWPPDRLYVAVEALRHQKTARALAEQIGRDAVPEELLKRIDRFDDMKGVLARANTVE